MKMTIIQALKRIKQLGRKIDRTNERIQRWCSYFDDEEPLYDGQEIERMIQSVGDMQEEIARIRHIMHITNATMAVEFEDKPTTIDSLLLEATVVIPAKLHTLKQLRRQEKGYGHSKEAKVVIQYDPKQRDIELDRLTDRQAKINDFIDTTNISTEIEV